jgi:hypothetical protein
MIRVNCLGNFLSGQKKPKWALVFLAITLLLSEVAENTKSAVVATTPNRPPKRCFS